MAIIAMLHIVTNSLMLELTLLFKISVYKTTITLKTSTLDR